MITPLVTPALDVAFARWLKLGAIALVVLFSSPQGPALRSASAAEASPPHACAAAENRQFDFWLGDWDAAEAGGAAKVARTRVERILAGCVLHELYHGADGHQGESFSLYLAAKGVWHQTWVTNRGEFLVIEGRFDNGQMILSGVEQLAGGKQRQVRGTWKPVRGGVRETAITSADGGKTWQPWFDLLFTPHRP
jgi:hypothetical protein